MNASAELDTNQRDFLLTIPNVPDSSVPVGTERGRQRRGSRWGVPPKFDFAPKPHWEVGERGRHTRSPRRHENHRRRVSPFTRAGERASSAPSRIFFLDVHTREHGYTEILPPFLVNTASLTGAGQLPNFAADLFKIQDTDFWLTPHPKSNSTISTATRPFPKKNSPSLSQPGPPASAPKPAPLEKTLAASSASINSRRSSFFKFTHPEKSYEEHEALVRNAETILQKLGLHYRTVLLCTGDMGFASAKTYDIEVWLPSSNEIPRDLLVLELRSLSIPPRRHSLQAQGRRQE